MLTIRLLPLFAIGCAGLPNTPGEITIQPDETTLDDHFQPVDDRFQPQDFESMDEDALRSLIWEQLNDLHALEVVQVGDVILDLPEEALCAYGWSPCPGFEEDVANALRAAGPRLETLTHFAGLAVDEGLASQDINCAEDAIEVNLDQLADLEIVTVGALLIAEPERNCPYNLPCDEDIALAEQITCERAEALDRIVELAQGL